MTFGEKVKKARKSQFLSQQAMAKELGVAYSTLNRWENSRFNPNYAAQKAFYEFCLKNKIVIKEE
ncbi:MAG: helix-turn-helix domain-containing protein [Firmicutes bacterium]|nr:helix-turn-helix domain-containing protein [Bacillota bacterium]